MNRHISRENPARTLSVSVDRLLIDGLPEWLDAIANEHGLTYLLAYADDGVIWGHWGKDGRLITSYDAAKGSGAASICPPLRLATLAQARLFAPHAEVMLWRDGNGNFLARLIADAPVDGADWIESLDEPQRLVGTHAEPLAHGFTLLIDGGQGLRHVCPLSRLPAQIDEQCPPFLQVRHYLAQEPFARIAVSRLAGLEPGSTNTPRSNP